ncbi:reverse transcriptase [Abeliophyllum distichum]|uniref:Reverse transcriptase n=1 Tax=Abeliophyllum distichum TaxID=126358 RepID=A0ABD1REV1_9LAMI
MLVDNKSSINVIETPLTPFLKPIYRFMSDGFTLKGVVRLDITIGEEPLAVRTFIEFFVVVRSLKLSTDENIATVKENQPEKNIKIEEAISSEDINPRVTGVEPQKLLVKELESFLVDPYEPTKTPQIGKDLPEELNETLKKFICRNLDAFAWKHEDMVGIDLVVSCRRLNMDPNFPSHR